MYRFFSIWSPEVHNCCFILQYSVVVLQFYSSRKKPQKRYSAKVELGRKKSSLNVKRPTVLTFKELIFQSQKHLSLYSFLYELKIGFGLIRLRYNSLYVHSIS